MHGIKNYFMEIIYESIHGSHTGYRLLEFGRLKDTTTSLRRINYS
jgi:hypothetical protein